jgi:phenylacetate-CoA ligase
VAGLAAYRRATRRQRSAPARHRAEQERRLRAIVRHAYQTVPDYRARCEARGLRPDDIRSLADLPKLPIVTKAELQAVPEADRLSSAFRRDALLGVLTSGSTGRPFTTFRELAAERRRTGYFLRALGAAGYRLGDRLMLVVERPQRPGTAWTGWRKLTFHEPPERLLEELNRHRPAVLYGYVSALRQLARHIRETGADAHRPRSVVTVSESLDPATRALLGDSFRAPVFDIYGSVEFGVIAWECATHDGYHVAEDSVLVETVQEGEHGLCRLVITNLNVRAMPLIRYDLGDFATRGPAAPCPCGCSFGRLGSIQGRVIDSVERPDGGYVPPFSLTTAVSEAPGIRRFQIVQEELGLIRVRIERTSPPAGDLARHIGERVRAIVGDRVQVVVEAAPSLEPPPGVKFRVVENRLTRVTS